MQIQESRNIPILTATAAIAFLIALVAPPAFARGTGAGASMGMGLGSQSSNHFSAQGPANINGPNASNRNTATLRAEDWMSANGLKYGRRVADGSVHATTGADDGFALTWSSRFYDYAGAGLAVVQAVRPFFEAFAAAGVFSTLRFEL